MKECVIYIRTSTEEQDPKNQLNSCLSIYKPEYGEHEIIEDKQSAWRENVEREGFDGVRKNIMNQSVKHLIIWDFDRLYRNRKNLKAFFELCKIHHCKIHSVRQDWLEKINTMPAPWDEVIHDLMVQIMGWLAQDESDKKSQRVRAAIRIDSEGAKFSYKGKKWGRKEITTQAMNKIIELRKQGKTFRQICQEVTYTDKTGNLTHVSLGIVHKILSGEHRKVKLLEKKQEKEEVADENSDSLPVQ